MEAQHHGLCHALLHPGDEGIPQQGKDWLLLYNGEQMYGGLGMPLKNKRRLISYFKTMTFD